MNTLSHLSISGMNQGPGTSKPDSLRDIILRIQDRVVGLNAHLSRIDRLTDGLCGGEPEAATKDSPPNPDIPVFAANNIDRLLNEYSLALEGRIARLETQLL